MGGGACLGLSGELSTNSVLAEFLHVRFLRQGKTVMLHYFHATGDVQNGFSDQTKFLEALCIIIFTQNSTLKW